MQTLTYAEARTLIKTGDMVGIHTGTIACQLIQAGQRIAGLPWSHITHCGLAVWLLDRLYLVEMNAGGNVYKPLSQYSKQRMVICKPAKGTELDNFAQRLQVLTENHIPYSATDLLRIGLRMLPMRFIDTSKWGTDSDATKVCSLLPAMAYKTLGGDVSAIPVLSSPAEVVKALEMRFSIEG